MLPGDIVVEINGVKVNTSEEIYQAVRSSNQITMVVQRGRELLQLQMTPEYTEWNQPHYPICEPYIILIDINMIDLLEITEM